MKWILFGGLTIIAMTAIMCLYLAISNPQSGKYAYRFHARVNYWLGKSEAPDLINPPLHYTGKWVDWFADGQKCEASYENGTLRGRIINWDAHGKISRDAHINEEKCLWQEWEDGELISKGIRINGEKWYGSFVVTHKGDYSNTNVVKYYLSYNEISKEEYKAWEMKTGGVERILAEHPDIK